MLRKFAAALFCALLKSFLLSLMPVGYSNQPGGPKNAVNAKVDIKNLDLPACLSTYLVKIFTTAFAVLLVLTVAVITQSDPLNSLCWCMLRYLAAFIILICLPIRCRLISRTRFFLANTMPLFFSEANFNPLCVIHSEIALTACIPNGQIVCI